MPQFATVSRFIVILTLNTFSRDIHYMNLMPQHFLDCHDSFSLLL